MLKLRDLAKRFHKKEVVSGMNTFFWFDHWNNKGQLYDLFGPRGTIELGVHRDATVLDACSKIRKRRHRSLAYREIQEDVVNMKNRITREGEDIHLWKQKEDHYQDKFITKDTWRTIRQSRHKVVWANSVWFKEATPKHSFIHWLACLDRLATKDNIKRWNSQVNSLCVFCNEEEETRNHLFLRCSYSANVWSSLMRGFMGRSFVTDWDQLNIMWKRFERDKIKRFLFQYTWQATIYNVWLERNRRIHRNLGKSSRGLVKMIQRDVKNKISASREVLDKNTMIVWMSYDPS